MTRQSRKQKYTLTAKKYTLAAKKYTLTRNRCARCGARFMPPYLCRRNQLHNHASETPHSSSHEPWKENFPENGALRGGGKDFSLSSPRLLALFAEPLAAGEEPLHPNGGLRCPARAGAAVPARVAQRPPCGKPDRAGTTGKRYRGFALPD